MRVLFGREPTDDMGPLYRLARKMAGSEDEKIRALGLNLLYDHRIGEERGRAFLRLANGAVESGDVQTLMDALRAYRTTWIARLPDETFAHPQDNRENHVFDLAPERGLDPDLELAHVCNISAKLAQIRDPAARQRVARLGFGRGAREVSAVLETLRGDAVRQRRFVEGFLQALELNRQTAPWHPVWAAGWDEFEQAIDPGRPESWMEAVGLQSPGEPQWLLVLRYRVAEARKLYRPTQLEAGSYAWHFPSPQCSWPPLRGGHPINLGNARTAVRNHRLLSEFVHAEIEFKPEHWERAGSLLSPTNGPTPGILMEHRRIHYFQLCEAYRRDEVRQWMPDPGKLP